ncbi:ATP-binding protein [Streptomyces sp. 8L]|uniref:ATP-binding protein n=1 Tax=Streptomyces sp. 8L TaxID=2877242 RepID=UPI001CD420D0|nr:biotin carboxylase N-terminal domain-containing protein [Streptomyces sp. 8L]MCA1219525.1 acety-l/propionyl-CoA carboxylase subunit alpha [Streptomyces sp. 8L]
MITSVLVANRGEIACRVFRTCRALGIATVAVYAEPDEGALHVREADSAVRLPGAAPADTYLRGDAIVRAALAAGADAVHPGYGFLSENAAFARAVREAGLCWIGPPPSAIEAMASKTRAKELMAAAGVPLLAPLDPAAVTAADLPLLVKAAAGGGGRGMRIVRELDALKDQLADAGAEALSAFGDGEVFVEPYVERGRHVEVQILADAHGTVWTLGTRDCSLQRRHQKVIEEAPAPGLPPETAETLYAASTAAARAVGYRGAGTVEFLLAPGGRPWFLEMNTRLQVEHPVTEEVFGTDLVAWQLAVADGEALPPLPPSPSGHAVEARLYAEDPARDWTPQAGRIDALDIPAGPPGAPTASAVRIRVDAGYAAGDTVGVHYDALLAKAVAWAPTRAAALRALAGALRGARLHGPATNRDLLVRSLLHPDFRDAAGLDTGFYDRHLAALTAPDGGPGARYAALEEVLADAAARSATPAPGAAVPVRIGAWRNLPSRPVTKVYEVDGAGTGPSAERLEAAYRTERDGYTAEDGSVRVIAVAPDRVTLETDGVTRHFDIASAPYEGPYEGPGRGPRSGERTVYVDGAGTGSYRLRALPRFTDPSARGEPGSLLAPMPGTVVRVADGLAEGAAVAAGAPLVWLEAMKMEHRVTAPAAGTLVALHAEPGRQVEMGAVLAVIAPPHEAPPGTSPGTAADTTSGTPPDAGSGTPPGTAPDAPPGTPRPREAGGASRDHGTSAPEEAP